MFKMKTTMNKKAYITPATLVVKIATAHIMQTGSLTGDKVYDKNADYGSTGFARKNSIWDDEDEDY